MVDINAYWKQQYRTTQRIGEYEEDPVVRLVSDCLKLTPQSSILDVGCATGLLLSKLSAGKKTGMDYSEHCLEKAKNRLPDSTFVLGDAERLPFADRTFDAALSHSTFPFFDFAYAERVISEMARVCKPGGRILVGDVSDVDRYPGGRLAYRLRTSLLDLLGKPYSVFYPRSFFTDRGFEVVSSPLNARFYAWKTV